MQLTTQYLLETDRTPGSILMEAYARNKAEIDLPWLNLGYWSNNTTHQMACQNMADNIAKFANLKNCSKIIDAGSGLCAPAIHWAKKYPKLRIFSLNIYADQIDEAQRWIDRFSLQDRIMQHRQNASEIMFSENSFDAVLALESAFHFNTRKDFFRESHRVLRQGGILALADMLPHANVSEHEPGYKNIKHYRIAKENLVCVFDYIRELDHVGFEIISYKSIRTSVYPYFYNFISKLRKHHNIDVLITPNEDDQKNSYSLWRDLYCLDDFILINAICKK